MSRTRTVPDVIKNNPHIAFRVDGIGAHIEGQEIIIPPFVVGDFLEVVFIRKHNTIFEYMHYLKEGWFDELSPHELRAIYTYAWDLAEAGVCEAPLSSSASLASIP